MDRRRRCRRRPRPRSRARRCAADRHPGLRRLGVLRDVGRVPRTPRSTRRSRPGPGRALAASAVDLGPAPGIFAASASSAGGEPVFGQCGGIDAARAAREARPPGLAFTSAIASSSSAGTSAGRLPPLRGCDRAAWRARPVAPARRRGGLARAAGARCRTRSTSRARDARSSSTSPAMWLRSRPARKASGSSAVAANASHRAAAPAPPVAAVTTRNVSSPHTYTGVSWSRSSVPVRRRRSASRTSTRMNRTA